MAKKTPTPKPQPLPDTAQLLALARADFACYVALLRPDLQQVPHVMAIIDLLEQIEHRVASSPILARIGQSLGLRHAPRAVVQLPPQHGKSTLAQLFVSWFLGRNPQLTVILVSYSADLAEAAGKTIRTYMRDPLFMATFPEPGARIAPDSTAVDHIGLIAGGFLRSVGRTGGVTGFRCTGLFLVDDLIKNRTEADSPATLAECHSFYSEVALTRLSSNAAFLCIGTSWNSRDLVSMLARDPTFRVLRLPALAEAGDELGRSPGVALWPEFRSAEQLEQIRQSMGSLSFAALYQCRPSLREGGLFQLSWFPRLKEPWQRPSYQRIVICWDCAQGKDEHGDFSACVVAGITNSHVDVLQIWRGRVDLTALKRKVLELGLAWQHQSPALQIVIEDTGFGTACLQECPGLWPGLDVPRFFAAKAKGSKTARAEQVLGMCESGRVRLSDGAWLDDWFLDELASAFEGVHDDGVDAMVHLLSHVQATVSGEPAPIVLGEPKYSIQNLRQYLEDGGSQRPTLDPAISDKISAGVPLSDAEEDRLIFGDLLDD